MGYLIAIVIIGLVIGFFVYLVRKEIKRTNKKNEQKEKVKSLANDYFDKLCQRYILMGTDAYITLDFSIEDIGKFCKKYSKSILMPGVQFNELESDSTITSYRKQQILQRITDAVQLEWIKIEGMNYSPTQVCRTDTIDALVKFAEKAIRENSSFVYITDDPALIVRIKCLSDSNNNTIEIHSASEVRRMYNRLHPNPFR